MKRITVLGCGMVGGAIAADLSSDFKVTVADADDKNLKTLKDRYPVDTLPGDLKNPKIVSQAIEHADLVVGAVPGFMGFETMKKVIQAGKNTVDIAFYNEDPFLLDALAKEKGVVAIMDCGVAPGMSNAILGYYAHTMEVESFECFVGGLPMKRSRPYEYKAPFSPSDVLEEYTRPARLIENGRMVTRPALSEPELIEFPEIGTLEAFNTDGLRSLMVTGPVPNMKEKTLRYPGHIDIMRILRETGFLSKEPVNIHGTSIRPLDLTSHLLFPKWKLDPTEPEFTVMRITIRGIQKGKPKEIVYTLLDRTDPVTGFSSMARTTGFACTAAVRLVMDGDYTRVGVSPPEFIGAESDCFEKMLAHQAKRRVIYHKEEYPIHS